MMTFMARHLALGAPSSCPRPTYGRTLGGTLVGDVVNVTTAGLGVVGGYFLGRSANAQKTALAAGAGGAVGYLAGIPLAMLADRAILRGPDCPNASLGRLFGARLAKGAIVGGVGLAAARILPDHAKVVRPVVSVAGLFATVPLTQTIIRQP